MKISTLLLGCTGAVVLSSAAYAADPYPSFKPGLLVPTTARSSDPIGASCMNQLPGHFWHCKTTETRPAPTPVVKTVTPPPDNCNPPPPPPKCDPGEGKGKRHRGRDGENRQNHTGHFKGTNRPDSQKFGDKSNGWGQSRHPNGDVTDGHPDHTRNADGRTRGDGRNGGRGNRGTVGRTGNLSNGGSYSSGGWGRQSVNQGYGTRSQTGAQEGNKAGSGGFGGSRVGGRNGTGGVSSGGPGGHTPSH